jgi:hypothetical protein
MQCRKRGTVAALTVALAAVVAATAASGSSLDRAQVLKSRVRTCHAQAQLVGYFRLPKHKLRARKTRCGAARKLAMKFSTSCLRAYNGQGTCRARVAGHRWRCRSRIVGPLDKGAPSREKCASKKRRVSFVVAFFPPVEPTNLGAPAAFAATAASPFDDAHRCVNTSNPGTVLPRASGTAFEIHLFGGTGPTVGNEVQSDLVAHKVSAILHDGLGSFPQPDPIWIYLTPTAFDANSDLGVAARTCADAGKQALVVRVDEDDPAETAAHELFHAHSFWAIAKGAVAVPWWEEASAEWSQAKVGYQEDSMYDMALQYPQVPLDQDKGEHKYAMSRFVQFLDDHSLIEDPNWKFQREVVSGYKNPGATRALKAAIEKRVSSPDPFGELLAAFWGDRLKAKPSHGQQLKPVNKVNSYEYIIKPGAHDPKMVAGPLTTSLGDFKLAPNVQRVEFEFDPKQGYFWGLVKPNESQRFRGAESVSFCRAGADQDDLEWPGHFPVTFTNGHLSGGKIDGTVHIKASTDAEQCTSPAGNRACRLLKGAKVEKVLGDGVFPFADENEDQHIRKWLCFYEGSSGEARLDIARHKTDTVKEVRKTVKQMVNQLNLSPIDVGDGGGIGTISGSGKVTGVLVFSVKREVFLLMVGPGAHHADLITLGKRLAGAVD